MEHEVFGAIIEKAKVFRSSHGDKPDFKDLRIVVNRDTYKALKLCLQDPKVYIQWFEPEYDAVNIECDFFNELGLNDGEVRISLRR